jgi:hypothetical protein
MDDLTKIDAQIKAAIQTLVGLVAQQEAVCPCGGCGLMAIADLGHALAKAKAKSTPIGSFLDSIVNGSGSTIDGKPMGLVILENMRKMRGSPGETPEMKTYADRVRESLTKAGFPAAEIEELIGGKS